MTNAVWQESKTSKTRLRQSYGSLTSLRPSCCWGSVLAWRSQHKTVIVCDWSQCRWSQSHTLPRSHGHSDDFDGLQKHSKHATLMSKSELGRASILPKNHSMEGNICESFLHLFWQPTVYMRTPLKANKDVSQEVVIAGCLDELARKGVFFARSSSSGTCVRYPCVPISFRSSSTGSTG